MRYRTKPVKTEYVKAMFAGKDPLDVAYVQHDDGTIESMTIEEFHELYVEVRGKPKAKKPA